MLDRFIRALSHATGHWIAFLLATIVVGIWVATDRPFDVLDAISAVTFWMVFVIQSSQNTDTAAIQKKLDEIVRVIPGADDSLRGVEERS